MEAFASVSRNKIVKVSAPAGFGKTVVMAQMAEYCRSQNMVVAWLALDESDNDIYRFLCSFSDALRFAGNVSVADDGELNAGIADSIMSFFDSLSRPIAMFFDSLECINNKAVLDLLYRGLQSVPDSSVVVIGARVEPAINFTVFRDNGEITEIGMKELKFSFEDTEQLYQNNLKLGLKPEDVAALYAHSEGWITALWLAALALRGCSNASDIIKGFTGTHASLAVYLAEEVLGSVDESIQNFLLNTSLIEVLDEGICNLILGVDNSYLMLQECENKNLLYREVMGENIEYRCNSMFRAYLYSQFSVRFSESERHKVHALACDYYNHLDRPVPAIRHAAAANLPDLAVALLRENVLSLLGRGRVRLLSGLIELVYPENKISDPLLEVIYAWCIAFSRGPIVAFALIENVNEANLHDQAKDCYLALRSMLLAMMDRVDEAHAVGVDSMHAITGKYPYASAMLHQALSQTSIILGEHELAWAAVDKVRDHMRDVTSEFGLVLAESAGAILDLMSGNLRQATVRIRLAISDYNVSRRSEGPGIAMANIHLAEMLYDSGQIENAKSLLVRNLSLVRDIGPPDALIAGHVILSRIASQQGSDDLALELLARLESDGYRLQIPRIIASAKLERANFYIFNKDFSSAAEQINESRGVYHWEDITNHWYLSNDILYPELVNYRLQIHSGKSASVVLDIRSELKHAELKRRDRRALKLKILLAEALFQDGQKNLALRVMTRAVQYADREGFIATFEEESELAAVLRQEVLNLGESKMTPSVDAGGSSGNDVVNSPVLEQWLTGKEQQVILLLAQGMSNSVIAERMFVSVSTVRTHLRNINLKLNASNRTEALVIARQLGILR
ncbi:hypothetical protein D0911_04300 [Zhongshania marina]|uniref:HTH luxR-type domain-containing protein n=1 Tax=Zhongshania marina TaxID=2304603 RepID=A0ABX9W5P6_9GAMM|nr:hypothetical protein D0911_04300 [Zhongshania marina]